MRSQTCHVDKEHHLTAKVFILCPWGSRGSLLVFRARYWRFTPGSRSRESRCEAPLRARLDLGISRPPIFGMTFCAPNLDGSAAFFSQEILGDSPPKMGCISTLPSSAYQGRAVEVSQSRPSRDDEKHAAGGVLPWGVVFGSWWILHFSRWLCLINWNRMMIILISAWILRVESCRIPSLVRSIHHFSPDILPILCQSNQQKHMPIPFFLQICIGKL